MKSGIASNQEPARPGSRKPKDDEVENESSGGEDQPEINAAIVEKLERYFAANA